MHVLPAAVIQTLVQMPMVAGVRLTDRAEIRKECPEGRSSFVFTDH